jgi:hypothetical protein
VEEVVVVVVVVIVVEEKEKLSRRILLFKMILMKLQVKGMKEFLPFFLRLIMLQVSVENV